jgi:hypothetical protein
MKEGQGNGVEVEVSKPRLVRADGKPTKKAELETWKSILSNEVGDEPRSRAWCRRALLRIYSNQEADEQLVADTTKRNGVGFTPADAPILTSLAKQMQQRGWLSAKQWEILYKLLPKYAGQLQRGAHHATN